MSFVKDHCLLHSFELLKSAPEQEKALLSVLVSKLPTSRLSNSVLRKLLLVHPLMNQVIGRAIVNLVMTSFTANEASIVQMKEPILFLSEMRLSQKQPAFAKFMVDSFVKIFKYLIQKISKLNHKVSRKEVLRRKQEKRRLARKKKLLAKKGLKEDEKSNMKVQHKEVTQADVDLNSRLFRYVLHGITRVIPYLESADVPNLTEELNVLERLAGLVENASVKIAIFNVLHQLALITE